MADDTNDKVADQIIQSCEKHWPKFKSNCSGFVRAVAADFGIKLLGDANSIISTASATWFPIKDGQTAAQYAAMGKFVIAAKAENNTNGHVVVVVKGPVSANGFPRGYWGSLGAVGQRNTDSSQSWRRKYWPEVIFFYKNVDQSGT